ncbi:serine/threonine-protein kinase [Streptomyces sp. NPDC048518]|uniref:serine/threonine-protein kinase n=1 Tax=Streptomyces sp. NPDC048518 TaxID=3155029 RepID=UPI0033FFFEB1
MHPNPNPSTHPHPRPATYSRVSIDLALRSDRELQRSLATASPLGSGIGGSSAVLQVADLPVFVKRVPLTEVELQPDHLRSTANTFGLPLFCQYGIGGPGFGAWREVAAHTMTTNWVLSGGHQGFPLMYHWRVLPNAAPVTLPSELADIERAVAYWGGGGGVRRRISGLEESSSSVVLFLEYIPQTLHAWLAEQVRMGPDAVVRACTFIEEELVAGTSFMNDRGLLHFDAHFQNILTDGQRLYFADFGLALSSRFDLSPAERDFFDAHRTYDRAYTLSYLVNSLISCLYGYERAEREALIRACAEGGPPPAGPPETAALLTRLAPLAAVVTDFLGRLQHESRGVPYPKEDVRRILGEKTRAHTPPPCSYTHAILRTQ